MNNLETIIDKEFEAYWKTTSASSNIREDQRPTDAYYEIRAAYSAAYQKAYWNILHQILSKGE